MGTIFWFLVGVLVGMFIPGPYNDRIKTLVKELWGKIFKKEANDPKDNS